MLETDKKPSKLLDENHENPELFLGKMDIGFPVCLHGLCRDAREVGQGKFCRSLLQCREGHGLTDRTGIINAEGDWSGAKEVISVAFHPLVVSLEELKNRPRDADTYSMIL